MDNNRLDQFNSGKNSYKAYLRKQAQDDMQALSQQMPQAIPQREIPEDPQPQAQSQYSSTPYQGYGSQPAQGLGNQSSILGAKAVVTQPFGNISSVEHFSGGVNYGADLGVPQGTPTAAPPVGTWQVVKAFNGAKSGYEGDPENSGYGNSVMIQNMQTGEKLRMSHLSQVAVQPGQVLKGGTVLGLTGQTGNATGPHLDLEYYNPQGQISDVLQSPYARFLGISGVQGSGPGGGGNPFQSFVNTAKQTVGNFYKGYREGPDAVIDDPLSAEGIGNVFGGPMGGESQALLGSAGSSLANVTGLASHIPQYLLPITQAVQNGAGLAYQGIKSAFGQGGGNPLVSPLPKGDGSQLYSYMAATGDQDNIPGFGQSIGQLPNPYNLNQVHAGIQPAIHPQHLGGNFTQSPLQFGMARSPVSASYSPDVQSFIQRVRQIDPTNPASDEVLARIHQQYGNSVVPPFPTPNPSLTQSDFEKLAAPIFQKYNVPYAVGFGQYAAEGRGATRVNNNPYNMGAYDNTNTAFNYPSLQQGIEAYARFITGQGDKYVSPDQQQMYKDALLQYQKDGNPVSYLQAIQKAGYAGDPQTWQERKLKQDHIPTPYDGYASFIQDTPEFNKWRNN